MVDPQPAIRHKRLSGRSGFTLVELLLVVGICTLMVGIALPAVASARRSAKATRCLANLRQISLAFHQYAMDNGGMLPDPFLNQKSWEASLRDYAPSADLFLCPSDSEVAPAIGSSYDWRDTGLAPTTLAGQSIATISRPGAVLAFDALAEWHGKLQINAVLWDGSARSMNIKECFGDLIVPVR